MSNKHKKTAMTVITATDLQRLSGQIIRRVHLGEHVIVERGGIPMVVLVPIADYQALLAEKRHKAR